MKHLAGAIVLLAGAVLVASHGPRADRNLERSSGAPAQSRSLVETHVLPEGHPPIPGFGPECPRDSREAAPGFGNEVHSRTDPQQVIST